MPGYHRKVPSGHHLTPVHIIDSTSYQTFEHEDEHEHEDDSPPGLHRESAVNRQRDPRNET
jgi:hypothetical protein